MGINNLHGKLLNFVSRPSTQVALCCGKTRFFESDGIDHECAIRVALDISSWIQRFVDLVVSKIGFYLIFNRINIL